MVIGLVAIACGQQDTDDNDQSYLTPRFYQTAKHTEDSASKAFNTTTTAAETAVKQLSTCAASGYVVTKKYCKGMVKLYRASAEFLNKFVYVKEHQPELCSKPKIVKNTNKLAGKLSGACSLAYNYAESAYNQACASGADVTKAQNELQLIKNMQDGLAQIRTTYNEYLATKDSALLDQTFDLAFDLVRENFRPLFDSQCSEFYVPPHSFNGYVDR